MEIEEIVKTDNWADEIEQDAVEKGYSDSDAARWKVAEEVTRQLAAGLSQRELAGMMSNAGEKKYAQTWIRDTSKVWKLFGAECTRYTHHYGAYVAMISFLPKGDFDAILEEASRTGQSPATIAKRIATENRAAKRAEKEAAENKKNVNKQKRIKAVKDEIKAKNDVIVEDDTSEEEESDEAIVRRFDSELSGIKRRSLDLIDLAADELSDVRVDVRLTINQHIDELINILNNAKLVISGTVWNEEI